ncbi:MAG: hypothetical protein VX916_05850 [Planctomycetota bacterium]|nr:hypothetical protein [Planctomycetota bacterium]
MPDQASVLDIEALREACGVLEAGLRTTLLVTGEDHRTWLDRIGSNPIQDAPQGKCILATLMDGKGRLQADLRILTLEESVFLDIPAASREAILKLLEMYIINEAVEVEDLSNQTRIHSVLGPRSREVMDMAELPTPTEEDGLAAYEGASVPGIRAVVTSRLCGLEGFDIIVDVDDSDDLSNRLTVAGGVRVEQDALDVVRLEQGIPWFEADLSGGVIPLEAGLDAWVSVTKGCYPGQEVVARIANLGQVSRKLVRLETSGVAPLNSPADLTGTGEQEGKTAGVLTSFAYDPTADITRALGYVRRSFLDPGTSLATADALLTVREATPG